MCQDQRPQRIDNPMLLPIAKLTVPLLEGAQLQRIVQAMYIYTSAHTVALHLSAEGATILEEAHRGFTRRREGAGQSISQPCVGVEDRVVGFEAY